MKRENKLNNFTHLIWTYLKGVLVVAAFIAWEVLVNYGIFRLTGGRLWVDDAWGSVFIPIGVAMFLILPYIIGRSISK